jgi:hypothetical protein
MGLTEIKEEHQVNPEGTKDNTGSEIIQQKTR